METVTINFQNLETERVDYIEEHLLPYARAKGVKIITTCDYWIAEWDGRQETIGSAKCFLEELELARLGLAEKLETLEEGE